jgi:transmembrane sensor
VAVAEGAVAIGTAALRAGDVAAVGEGRITVTHGADIATFGAWRTGTLVFDATPLRDVLADLARWYGLRIIPPSGPFAERPFTATLANEPPESALRIVATAVAARLERHGPNYTLVPLPALRGTP